MPFGFGAGANLQKEYHRLKSQISKRKGAKEIAELYPEDRTVPRYNKMSPPEFKAFKADLKRKKIRQDWDRGVVIALLIALGIFLFYLIVVY